MASFISISSGEVSNSINSSPSPPLDSLIIVLGFGVGDPPLIKKNTCLNCKYYSFPYMTFLLKNHSNSQKIDKMATLSFAVSVFPNPPKPPKLPPPPLASFSFISISFLKAKRVSRVYSSFL